MPNCDFKFIPGKPEHAEFWKQMRDDAQLLRFNPIKNLSIELLRERLASVGTDLSRLDSAKEFLFVVEADGVPTATMNLLNINLQMMTAEIGYAVHPNFRSKGLGTRAVRVFVEKLFSETNLRRLSASITEGNIASRKIVENIGFKPEGLIREGFLLNGLTANVALYGLLRSEFSPPQ
jgi:[ribosomal protein S5]-alanine N-acetyltransferase